MTSNWLARELYTVVVLWVLLMLAAMSLELVANFAHAGGVDLIRIPVVVFVWCLSAVVLWTARKSIPRAKEAGVLK